MNVKKTQAMVPSIHWQDHLEVAVGSVLNGLFLTTWLWVWFSWSSLSLGFYLFSKSDSLDFLLIL